MEDRPDTLVNLATKLAEIFENRPDETRSWLSMPEWWIRESHGAEEFLAGELSRIHFRLAVDGDAKTTPQYWLDRADDPVALGLTGSSE